MKNLKLTWFIYCILITNYYYMYCCSDVFCTVYVVIYWQVPYPLWWIAGILNKWMNEGMNKYHLHRATANLSCLPCGFTSLNNEKTQFKTAIRNMRSFYSAYNKHDVLFEYCTWDTYDRFVLYMLYFYDSFHILLSHWPRSGSMECVRYLCRAINSTLHQLQQLWPVHVVLQILTHNCHFFLRYKILCPNSFKSHC